MVSTHNKSGGKSTEYMNSFQSRNILPQRDSCTFDSKHIFIDFSIGYQNLIVQVPKQRHPHLQGKYYLHFILSK